MMTVALGSVAYVLLLVGVVALACWRMPPR